MKEMILDTNVFRRLIENNKSMIAIMNSLTADGFVFRITDLSLFELLSNDFDKESANSIVKILIENKVAPTYKEMLKNFDFHYADWLKGNISNDEMLTILFPSFSFTMSNFLANLTKGIITFIANSLTNDYSSIFYNIIVNIVEDKVKDIIKHYEKVLKDCYILKKEKLRKRMPLELKDLILRLLTYYNLLIDRHINEDEFNKEFCKLKNKYRDDSFKDICSQIVDANKVVVSHDQEIDQLDLEFMLGYFKTVLCKNANFNINDIVDYLNLKYANQFKMKYYSIDYKSFNKYRRYLTNTNILNFIDECEQLSKTYYFKP